MEEDILHVYCQQVSENYHVCCVEEFHELIIVCIFSMTVSASSDCRRLLVILIALSVEDTTWPASLPRYIVSFEP